MPSLLAPREQIRALLGRELTPAIFGPGHDGSLAGRGKRGTPNSSRPKLAWSSAVRRPGARKEEPPLFKPTPLPNTHSPKPDRVNAGLRTRAP
jgi:hypothetical protein